MTETITTIINLITPNGNIAVPMQIDTIYKNDAKPIDEMDPDCIQIKLRYNGTLYYGEGTDFLWTDAMADLQANLPDGILVCCCMTCRYGNMCPFGNEPRILFCSKNQDIHSKNDLISFFGNSEITLPTVLSDGFCEAFVYQDIEHYTYNDYYLHYKRKQNTT